jgi:hypothetical protein
VHKGDKADLDCPRIASVVYGRSETITLEFEKCNPKDSAPKVIDQANPCISHKEHASMQAAEIPILLMDQQ